MLDKHIYSIHKFIQWRVLEFLKGVTHLWDLGWKSPVRSRGKAPAGATGAETDALWLMLYTFWVHIAKNIGV